jgi:hypothetical protein
VASERKYAAYRALDQRGVDVNRPRRGDEPGLGLIGRRRIPGGASRRQSQRAVRLGSARATGVMVRSAQGGRPQQESPAPCEPAPVSTPSPSHLHLLLSAPRRRVGRSWSRRPERCHRLARQAAAASRPRVANAERFALDAQKS